MKLFTQSEGMRLTPFSVEISVRPFPSVELVSSNAPPGWPEDGVLHMLLHNSTSIKLKIIWVTIHLSEFVDSL